MHISIYSFLTHRAKILLLQITSVRKRKHNGVTYFSDKTQLSYKKHATSFSLLHSTIKEKIVSLVTVSQPYPANNLHPLCHAFSPQILFPVLVLILCRFPNALLLTTIFFNVSPSCPRNVFR